MMTHSPATHQKSFTQEPSFNYRKFPLSHKNGQSSWDNEYVAFEIWNVTVLLGNLEIQDVQELWGTATYW